MKKHTNKFGEKIFANRINSLKTNTFSTTPYDEENKLEYNPDKKTKILWGLLILLMFGSIALNSASPNSWSLELEISSIIFLMILFIISLFRYSKLESMIVSIPAYTLIVCLPLEILLAICYSKHKNNFTVYTGIFLLKLLAIIIIICLIILIAINVKTPFKVITSISGIIIGIASIVGVYFAYLSIPKPTVPTDYRYELQQTIKLANNYIPKKVLIQT